MFDKAFSISIVNTIIIQIVDKLEPFTSITNDVISLTIGVLTIIYLVRKNNNINNKNNNINNKNNKKYV